MKNDGLQHYLSSNFSIHSNERLTGTSTIIIPPLDTPRLVLVGSVILKILVGSQLMALKLVETM